MNWHFCPLPSKSCGNPSVSNRARGCVYYCFHLHISRSSGQHSAPSILWPPHAEIRPERTHEINPASSKPASFERSASRTASVRSGDPLIAFDATMSTAELGHLKSDLLGSELDVARLKAALNKALNPLTAFAPPGTAPLALVEMHRRFLISQTAEQAAKLATINGQIAQKEAERATSKALSEKLRAVLNPLQQRVEIREQLFQKGLGSKINYLTELQDLVTQRQELTVQDSRHSEAEAAIAVLVEMRTKAVAEYERSLFEELAKAEQKVAGLTQDVIRRSAAPRYRP